MRHAFIARFVALATSALLCGCAMFAMPDFAAMQQQELATARADIRANASPEQRADAARTLGRAGDASDVPRLVAALGDAVPAVRREATDALRQLGSPAQGSAADVMTALQMEKEPAVATAMGWLLYTWDVDLKPAETSLRAVLKDADLLYRFHAAQLLQSIASADDIVPVYLGVIGTPVEEQANNKPSRLIEDLIPSAGAVVWPLLERATADSNAARRAASATLVSRFKPFPSTGEAILIRLLHDADARVRAAAAWSCLMAEPEPLGAGPTLLTLLEDEDADVRANSARALGQFLALGKAPPGSAEALGRRMADANPHVREYTAQALGSVHGLPESVARQIAARLDPLREPEATVRAAAAAALDVVTPTSDVKAALRRAFDDADETVRERSIASMGHLRVSDPDILRIIAARTGAGSGKGERLTALGALRDIGRAAQAVQDAVLRVLQDPDPDIQQGATYAAGQMGLTQPGGTP